MSVDVCVTHTCFSGAECLIILLDSVQLGAINHQSHHFFGEIFATSKHRRNVNFLEVGKR